MEVCFVGLGAMGSAMAVNLAKAGCQVKAWARSGKENSELAASGIKMVATLDEAVQAGILFTMLPDDAAIRAMLLHSGVLARAPSGLVHVVSSTLSVGFTRRSYESYAAKIAAENYEPGFRAKLGLKDLWLATEAGKAAGQSLPMLEAVRGRMAETVEVGLVEQDWSVMADVTLRGVR